MSDNKEKETITNPSNGNKFNEDKPDVKIIPPKFEEMNKGIEGESKIIKDD